MKSLADWVLLCVVCFVLIDFIGYQNGRPSALHKMMREIDRVLIMHQLGISETQNRPSYNKTPAQQTGRQYHPVPPQTEEESEPEDYLSYEEKMRERYKVYVLPLGDVEQSALDEVENSIRDMLGLWVMQKTQVPLRPSHFIRDSLDADFILDEYRLQNYRHLIVYDGPLTTRGHHEALGYALMNGCAMVMSSRQHIPTVAVHEVCHTLGLDHCQDRRCLMFYMALATDAWLCPNCRQKLMEKHSWLTLPYEKVRESEPPMPTYISVPDFIDSRSL